MNTQTKNILYVVGGIVLLFILFKVATPRAKYYLYKGYVPRDSLELVLQRSSYLEDSLRNEIINRRVESKSKPIIINRKKVVDEDKKIRSEVANDSIAGIISYFQKYFSGN